MMNRVYFTICCLLSSVILLGAPNTVYATDDENCLMCHKYAGLGRYGKDENQNAKKRVFYVNEDQYKASYHGKLRCKNCHEGLEEIPHTDAKAVDCAKECHMKDPSTGRDFSHKDIKKDLDYSAHGVEGTRSEEHTDDLPVCKDCHSNKAYQTGVEEQIESMKFIKICLECHESKEWTERFYSHIFYRASTRRPSKEVVALCSKCHADPAMMDRHELDVVVGFKDTFHGKAIVYGDEDVANCLNCHAPYELGFSPHRVKSRREDTSPVSPENKLETCAQQGCHAGAKEEFASKGKAHASQESAVREAIAGEEVSQAELAFQTWVLYLINLIYKIAIVVVVGGLGIHRLLDLYASRRERKLGGHH
jgi:hypothetical protein